jgi:hypothetical protein
LEDIYGFSSSSLLAVRFHRPLSNVALIGQREEPTHTNEGREEMNSNLLTQAGEGRNSKKSKLLTSSPYELF